jgi:hypothetical protein
VVVEDLLMPWVKVDDHADEHPKLAAAGPLAWPLWLSGLTYCNRNLTDGFIPRSVARTLVDWQYSDAAGQVWTIGVTSGAHGEDVNSDLVIDLLVEVGLWEKVPGGYRVHDYEDYQPTRAEVMALREVKREAGRAGGRARAEQRARHGAKQSAQQTPSRVLSRSSSKTQAEALAKSKPVPVPVPVPVEKISRGSSSGGGVGEPVRAPRDAVLLDGQTRPDLVALRERGMTYIRANELEILDHIADNERAGEWQPISTGQDVIAGWIHTAPAGVHLVDHVIHTENELKRQRGAEADVADEEWNRQKEADRRAAPEQLGSIVARLVPGQEAQGG